MPRAGNKKKLCELVEQRQWLRIGEAEWNVIRVALPAIKPEDLQVLTVPVEPPWNGVSTRTEDELESSLCALSGIYASREDLRRFCRAADWRQLKSPRDFVVDARHRSLQEMARLRDEDIRAALVQGLQRLKSG